MSEYNSENINGKLNAIKKGCTETGKDALITRLDNLGFGIPSIFINGYTVLRDGLYYEKINIFLDKLDDKGTREKIEFYNENVVKDKDKFYKNVLMKLESINEVERIEILANLFHATISGDINQNQWERLSYMVTSMSYYDIQDFDSIKFIDGKIDLTVDTDEFKTLVINKMITHNLIIEINVGTHKAIGGNKEYQQTELGELFFKYKNPRE